MTSPEFPVTSQVLRWAREKSGFSIEEVAAKLASVGGITAETVGSWEEGYASPRLTALRKLAQLYKRPMAVFFLDEPPPEPVPPKNFRVLPSGEPKPLSPQTLLAVRTARRLQEIAREITEDLGREPDVRIPEAHLSGDPVALAADERKRLGASLEEQMSFADAGRALWYWRDLVESVGCFVFQFPFPTSDTRAFSEYLDDGPIIVLSSKDEPVARVFSVFHEYAHLLLRLGGICPDFGVAYMKSFEGQVEQFCNAFAASFLVPAPAFVAAADQLQEPTSEGGIVQLSYRFSVSKHTILRRFLDLGWVDLAYYRQKDKEWDEAHKGKKSKGGPKQDLKALSQRGRRFTSLVLEARDRGLLSPPAVVESLGVRTKYLGEIREQLF